MGPIDPLTGESAVRQVLEAEREARDRIAAARKDAGQALEQGRAEVRAIERRAVEAAGRVQQSARAFGDRRLARLEADTERLLAQSGNEHPEDEIDELARALARELIGIDRSEPDRE